MRLDEAVDARPDGLAVGVFGDAVTGVLVEDQFFVGAARVDVDIVPGVRRDRAVVAALHDQQGRAQLGQRPARFPRDDAQLVDRLGRQAGVVPEPVQRGAVDDVRRSLGVPAHDILQHRQRADAPVGQVNRRAHGDDAGHRGPGRGAQVDAE